jgi:FlaA1/EpsC-like NDP-sugar epimerase
MEKIELPIKKNKLFQLWLIIGVVTGFVAILFFLITYLNENILCDLDCRIQNEVSIVLILVSLFGMFIGSLTYYFISEKYERKIIGIHRDANSILKFLEDREKSVVDCIIRENGKTTQSKITRDTGLSKIKVCRILKKLENKKIIVKKSHGMTNSIELEEELKKVLIE